MSELFGFSPRESIGVCGIAWLLSLLWVLGRCRNGSHSVGIPTAYSAVLLVGHIGAFIYFLPWYDPADSYLQAQGADLENVSIGFQVSTLGMFCFAVGVEMFDRLVPLRTVRKDLNPISPLLFGRFIAVLGVIFFFVILPVASKIPSGAAIGSAGVQLCIVGICLVAYGSSKWNLVGKMQVLFATACIPMITVLAMGFIGYAVSAILSIVSFISTRTRFRWWFTPVALIAFWLLLSFYVAYMNSREAIREKVWGNASLEDRIEVVTSAFREVSLFDPSDNKQLSLIDTRMNQNNLVGACVHHIATEGINFAYGESIYLAAVSWVPRVIWTNKPTFGGSGDFAARYTGMNFAKFTSVGAGMVMEMYANFGLTGVTIGFLICGMFIRFLDRKAAANLSAGQLWDYVRFHLIGICAIQPLGFLAEAVSSSVAALFLSYVLKQLLIRNRHNLRFDDAAVSANKIQKEKTV